MKKASYDAIILEHQNHIERAIVSANSVANAFKIDFDDNGTKTELSYGYEPSLQDTEIGIDSKRPSSLYKNERLV
jgi:hypothetical protein